ncbi:unnamed protein product [Cochlearia groenlandica]
MNNTIYTDHCQKSLFNISSQGFWENLKSPNVIFGYSLPLLEIQILLIFVFIVMTHMFLRRIGISQIASYMIAGLILRPRLFDVLEKSSGILSMDPALDGNAALRSVSVFGTLMFTFLMTVRTSRRVAFNSGQLPLVIGVVSFFVPLLGLGFKSLFSDKIDPQYMPVRTAIGERVVIVITQSAILLPSTTFILLELKILNSEIGRLALSACVINDIFGIVSIVIASVHATYVNVSHVTAYRDAIGVVVFVLVVFLVFKPIVQWIIDRTPEGQPVEDKYVHAVILIALGSSVYSMIFNMKYVLGPLVIGLVIPEGPPLGSALEAKYERLTMNVFLPITITVSVMRCDGIRIFSQFSDIIYNVFLTALTLVLKLVACLAPCLYYKLPLNESLAVSIILSYKSFSDFVLYESVLDDMYISQATYAFLIFYSLLNAGIVPTVLRILYDPKRKYINYQKRNILNLESHSDLRVLTCLHRPENVSETIALLQLLASPNLDFPIAVTVLHLVKLVGQINPVLVSHNKKSNRLHNNSYIHTANLAFRQFMLESLESVTVATFTAFSHEKMMHEDICTLALDHTASMIILPSGRRWTIDGIFESDDESIRRLNQSLLERAPCSIGILIDRGQFSRTTNVMSKRKYIIDVGMIFIGGKDDREALSLVKRMRHNPRVRITVVRLFFNQEIESEDWEYVLDNEGLKDIKSTDDTSNVGYIERTAKNGAEVATMVRMLAGEYDLMVVGRDQGMESSEFCGLTEWVELPELGIVGDLLAAKELSSKVSVLFYLAYVFMNTTTYTNGCRPLLFNISSFGIWEDLKSPDVVLGYALTLLEIQILLIFIFIVTSHMFLRCIGISQIASHFLAGLILGPQLIDLLDKSSDKLSQDPALDGSAALRGISVCGNILLTFLMSVRISRRLAFNNGKLPIVLGTLTFIVPLFGGLCFRNLNTDNIDPHYMSPKKVLAERTVIISSQSSILLPTVTYILSELKILNSELGRLVLSASMINDVLGIIVSILAYAVGTYKYVSPVTAYRDIIGVIVFFLVVFFVFRPSVEWIVERTPEGRPVADKYVHIAILSAMGSAAYSSFFNMKYLLGPFTIGLIIPDGPPFGSALEAKYYDLTMSVLIPISIAFSTMRCDVMKIIYEFDDIMYNIFLLALTLAMKLAAGVIPCLYCRLPVKEAFAVSILLSCKSFSELFLYESTFDDSYISQATYTFLILYALLNSGIVPAVLTNLYDPKRKYIGYKKRNILSLKPNSDLRILTCVHKPENISGAIKLLQLLSSPNKDLPVVVTVLYLVKLVGKLIPVLISHNKKSKRVMNNSYIHTANLAFSQLDSAKMKMTMFTALTHQNLMHDEVCALALDKTTSMIIVPSGRKWTIDGAFESDDEAIRRLNTSLLEHTPCSVGILVDRGQFSRQVARNYNIEVGVIFIGGKDDREAISLVKRMKLNSRVNVTVIRVMSNKETESMNWENILDDEVLENLKCTEATNRIGYMERTVTGGPDLAITVRLLSREYDLMVVGRDHGTASPDFNGITEWIELRELGVIGDLLATKDLNSTASVLVVQQQQT